MKKPTTLPPRLGAGLAITAFCFALGFILADNGGKSSFWYDELWSLDAVSGSFANMLRLLRNDFHPPGFHILLYGWVRLVGTGEAAARSLSMIFLVAAIPLTYLLGRALRLERAASVFGAGFFYFSSGTLWYGVETRATAMLVFLTTAALLTLLRSTHSRTAFWSSTLLGVLALYSHYAALFVLIPAALLLAWQERDRKMLLIPIVWVVALLPWALQIISQARHFASAGWLQPPTWAGFENDARRMTGFLYAAQAFFVLFAALLAESIRRRGFVQNLWLWVPLTVGAGTALFSHWFIPIFHFRYLLPVVPFLGLGAGYLLQTLRPPPVRWAVAILVPLSYAFFTYGLWENYTVKGEDWRGTAELALSRSADATLVVTTENSRFFRHYIPGIIILPEDDQAAIDAWLRKTGPVKVWFLQARQYAATPATRTMAARSQVLSAHDFTAARALHLEMRP